MTDSADDSEIQPSNKIVYALIALALIGLGFSVYLASHFYEVRLGGTSFKSICNIGSKMNCDAVAASRYSELAFGIPLASFAAGWYLGLVALYFFVLTREWRREAIRFAVTMTGFAVLMSLLYVAIMARMHTYCLFCLFLDVVSFSSFGLVWLLKPACPKAFPIRFSQWKGLGLVVLGCLFVAVVGLKGLDGSNLKSSDIEWQVNDILSKDPLPVGTNPRFPSLGPASAPITIVEFSDFECPFCKLGALVMNTLTERYPTQVHVIFRNYPLDMSCNTHVTRPMHQYSCEAARAGYCANQQGRFEDLYKELFENQEHLGTGKPLEWAKKLEYDEPKLHACMAAPETNSAIQTDIEEGTRLGITSTPTFFIQGRKVEGIVPLPVWAQLIEHFLQTK